MGFDFDKIAGAVGEEQAMSFLQNLDEEQLNKMVRVAVEQFVAPALIEIRQNAKAYRQKGEDRHAVRQTYESKTEEEQLQRFDNALVELRKTAEKLRHNPSEGVKNAKSILRNPWYHEAILLAFDIEEYETEPKEFFTYTGRWALMALIPEAYTEEEARDLVEEMFDGVTYEQALSQAQKAAINRRKNQ